MVTRSIKQMATLVALVAIVFFPQTSFAETEKAERICQSDTVELSEGLYGLCRNDLIAFSAFDTKLEVLQANTSYIFLGGTVNGEPRKVLVRKGGERSYAVGSDQKIVFSYKGKANEGALLHIEVYGAGISGDTLTTQERIAQLRETQENTGSSVLQQSREEKKEEVSSKRMTLKERVAQLLAKRNAAKTNNRFVQSTEEKKEVSHTSNRIVQQPTQEDTSSDISLLKVPEYSYDEEGCQSAVLQEKRRRVYEAFRPVNTIRTWSKTEAQMRAMGATFFDFDNMNWTAAMPYSNRGNYYWKDYGMRMSGDAVYGGMESILLRQLNGNTSILNQGAHPCTTAYNPLVLSFHYGIKAIAFDMAGYDLNNGTGKVTAHIRAFDKENNELYSTREHFRTKKADHYFSVKFDKPVHRVTLDYGGSQAAEEIDNLWVRFTKDGLGPVEKDEQTTVEVLEIQEDIPVLDIPVEQRQETEIVLSGYPTLLPTYDDRCGGRETQTMRDNSAVYYICLNQRALHKATGINVEPLSMRGQYAKVRLHSADGQSKTVYLFKKRFVRVVNGEGKSVYLLFQSKREFLGDKAQILVVAEQDKEREVDTYPNSRIGRTYRFVSQVNTQQAQAPCAQKDTKVMNQAGLYYICEGQAMFDQKTEVKVLVTELIAKKAGVKILWPNGSSKYVSIFSGEYIYIVNEAGEKFRLTYDRLAQDGNSHPDAAPLGAFRVIYEEDFQSRFVWEQQDKGLNYPADEDAPYYYYNGVKQATVSETPSQSVLCNWSHSVERGNYSICRQHKVIIEGTNVIVIPYYYTKNLAFAQVKTGGDATAKRVMFRKNKAQVVTDNAGNTVSVNYGGTDAKAALGSFSFK